jgi:hypothetical protein
MKLGHGVMFSLMSKRVNMGLSSIQVPDYTNCKRYFQRALNSDEADGVMRRLRR